MMVKSDSHSKAAGHVCPWWIGPLLCCPVRKLWENPDILLGPHVKAGMKILEPGCGMGYFTLPLARMAGEEGRVICRDIQPGMVSGLLRRARRAGLSGRIDAATCTPENLDIDPWTGQIDLAVTIHMIHEVEEPETLLRQLHGALRDGGQLLILEPKGHVSPESFDTTLRAAARAGLVLQNRPGPKGNLAALLIKDSSHPLRS